MAVSASVTYKVNATTLDELRELVRLSADLPGTARVSVTAPYGDMRESSPGSITVTGTPAPSDAVFYGGGTPHPFGGTNGCRG